MREKKKLLAGLCVAFVCLLGILGVLLATEGNGADKGNGESVEEQGTDPERGEAAAGNDAGSGSGETVAENDADGGSGETAAGVETVTLSDLAPDEVEKIEIRNAEAAYEIVSSSASKFALAGYEKYRQDQEALQTTVRLLSSVTATRIYERDFEKDKFGLTEPGAVVTITGKEEAVTFYLGSWNESMSVWYAMKEGDEGLYSLGKGIGDKMMASPFALLDRTLLPALDFTSEEMTEHLDRIAVERPDLEEPLEIVASAEPADAYTSAYELVSPVSVKTSLKVMREQIASLFGLSAREIVGIYDPQKASLYGLDEPSMEMTVRYDGEELTLTVGKIVTGNGEEGKESGGGRYLICSDSDLLYIMEESSLPFFRDTVDDLFFGMALLPKIDEVKEVYLKLRGEEYLFALTHEETLQVVLDGQELDAGLFREFYAFLLEVDIEEINRDSHTGEPVMVVEYRYLDGGADRLEAYELENARRMGVAVNGNPSFEGRAAYLDKLRTELSHLLAGERIDTNW